MVEREGGGITMGTATGGERLGSVLGPGFELKLKVGTSGKTGLGGGE